MSSKEQEINENIIEIKKKDNGIDSITSMIVDDNGNQNLKLKSNSIISSLSSQQLQPPPIKETPKMIIEKLQQSFRNMEGETMSIVSPISIRDQMKIKTSNWEIKGFRNPVRQDQLILSHWTKSNNKNSNHLDNSNFYKYSKFNKKMDILMYNDDEYDWYLKDENWTKDDTNQIIELCKRFDTRFIIVADRFNSSTIGIKKSIEDIKERYYRIQSKLIELRSKPEEDPFRNNPLASYQFNKQYEIERKLHSEKLFHLTKDQIKEEESLYKNYVNIEKHLIRHSTEVKSVLKRSQQTISNGPLKHHIFENNNNNSSNSSNNKKKRKHNEIDSNGLIQHHNQKHLGRIESTLNELEIQEPKNNLVAKHLYQDLREDISILLDLQKFYIEKRYHCEILKSQRKFLENELEILSSQIPFEALNMQVDEENETIANSNLTSDSESQTLSSVSSSTIHNQFHIPSTPSSLSNTNQQQMYSGNNNLNDSINSPINNDHSVIATNNNNNNNHHHQDKPITTTTTTTTTTSITTPHKSTKKSLIKEEPQLTKEEKKAIREKKKADAKEKKLKKSAAASGHSILNGNSTLNHSNQSTPSSINTPQLITSNTTIQPMNIDFVPSLTLNPTTANMISPLLNINTNGVNPSISQLYTPPLPPNTASTLSPQNPLLTPLSLSPSTTSTKKSPLSKVKKERKEKKEKKK